MNDNECEWVMMSALQHVQFCPRQCYLIHAEQLWSENYLTLTGKFMHERVDLPKTEYIAPGIRHELALHLNSERLHVYGRADRVEFNDAEHTVFPVEFKHGAPKPNAMDSVQLCAQAMALEEMLDCDIPTGVIFYGKIHRRVEIQINNDLRNETQKTADAVRTLIQSDTRPPVSAERKKCTACSLIVYCFPEVRQNRTVEAYINTAFEEDEI